MDLDWLRPMETEARVAALEERIAAIEMLLFGEDARLTKTTCTQCSKGFLARADAKFCSSACRQKAYRRRNK